MPLQESRSWNKQTNKKIIIFCTSSSSFDFFLFDFCCCCSSKPHNQLCEIDISLLKILIPKRICVFMQYKREKMLVSVQVADVNAMNTENISCCIYWLLVSTEYVTFTALLSIHALHCSRGKKDCEVLALSSLWH